MWDFVGIIVVTMSVLSPGGSSRCGTLNFDKQVYSVGGCALLIYTPSSRHATREWMKGEYPNVDTIKLNRSSKYSESNLGDNFTLTIHDIDTGDVGPYRVYCSGVYTDPAYLKVNASSNEYCGKLEFEKHIVHKGASASLIYEPNCATASVDWNKMEPNRSVLLYSNKTYRNFNKYTESNTSDGFVLSIKKTELADAGFYAVFCGKWSPQAKLEIIDTRQPSATFEVTGLFDPESVEIKTQPTKENESSIVQCTTTNGRPPSRSLFYLRNNLQNSAAITKQIQSGYTYNVITTLRRKFTRQDNQASVHCCSNISFLVCSDKEYLNVTFSPRYVELTEINKVSKENGDTELVLKCDVDESNPKSFVVWKGVKNLPGQLLEEKYINHTATHGWKYTTTWKFNLTKNDMQHKIICEIKNSEFKDLLLQKSYKPNITYSPLITISENGIKTVFIGSDVKLTCHVDSNPPSVMTWYNATNKVEESNGASKLVLHLVNVTVKHSQVYTCKARNDIGGPKSRNITLIVKVLSEKTFNQPSSEANVVSFLGPVMGGTVVLIIAIVSVVVFLTLRKNRNRTGKRKGTRQIKDEPRNECVHPARNESLYNDVDMPVSNEKEVDNAPEYACVIPKANRKHGTDQLKSEDAPEYAGVIPKAKRKSEPDPLKSKDTSEYACVIPNTERKYGKHKRKSEDASSKSLGDTLVYAELDLNFGSETTARRPLTKQYEPTEYVTIDFSKTGSVKIEKEDIETGAVKTEHDEMATGCVKKEDKDI